MLIILTILIFLGVLVLSITGPYFLFKASRETERIRTRVAAVEESSIHGTIGEEGELVRRELLTQTPLFYRITLKIPALLRVQIILRQAGLQMRAEKLLLISFMLAAVAFTVGWLANLAGPLIGLVVLGAGTTPILVVVFKRHQRFSKFEEQFPDALDLLARAVRAGHAFTTGFELIAAETSEPLAGEFRAAYDQQNLGLPLREALENLVERVPLPDVRLFVTALQIQHDTGGNLAEILDNLSYVIRERFRLYRDVKSKTAEGRMSLYFLMALPPIAGCFMYLANPDYIAPLFSEQLGQRMLMGSIILQIMGYFVIRKITNLKV